MTVVVINRGCYSIDGGMSSPYGFIEERYVYVQEMRVTASEN